MDRKMRILIFLMVVITAVFLLTAPNAGAFGEVYRWVDEKGMVHYGDRPPQKPDVQTVEIDKSPRSAIQPSPDSPYAVDESGKKELSYAEKKRKEREDQRQSAKKSKAQLDEACAERRKVVTELEPTTRILVRTEDGEVHRMDDNIRLENLAAAKKFLEDNCND